MEVTGLQIDMESIKELNQKLVATEPTSRLSAYLWGQVENQYEPITGLMKELICVSIFASLCSIICGALFGLPLGTVFPEREGIVFRVLIPILAISLFVLIRLVGHEIDLMRETPQYAEYEAMRWKKDLHIVENYMNEHALSVRQRVAFYELCVRRRDAFLAERSDAIASTFAVEGAVGLAVAFALVQVLIDYMSPGDAATMILAVGFAVYGLLKAYLTVFETLYKNERKNPVGKLVRILELARINGILGL